MASQEVNSFDNKNSLLKLLTLLQISQGLAQGLAAVADAILDFQGQLRQGFTVLRDQKQRIITETAAALRRFEDQALQAALEQSAVTGRCAKVHGAVKGGLALPARQSTHGSQQLAIVVGIAGLGAGVTGGIDSGFTLQGLDYQAGIVG